MRIALLTDGIYPYVIGGMQKHSFYLAKYLAQNKVFIDLFHFNHSDKDISLLEFFTDEEKKYIHSIVLQFPKLDPFPGHYIRESYRYSEMIFEKIKNELNEYDFIYTKGFSGWKLIEEKNKGLKACAIGVNFHGYEMFQKPPSLKSRLEHLILRPSVRKITKAADIVFSYGGKITPIIESIGVDRGKIVELSTGIDSSWINKKECGVHQPIKFVFVGRFERRKGINELNVALNQILKTHNFLFNFVGPIPIEKQIQHHTISYLGAINDADKLKQILAESDVLVCPSHSEGMPNVIMEAMASGLAIIATDVGAVSVQVDKNVGFLIPPGDVKALNKAIEIMIDLPKEQLLLMKNNAIKKIEDSFCWDKIIVELINQINRINEKA